MAKHLTGIVLSKRGKSVKFLLLECKTKVDILKEELLTDVRVGQKVAILYDFTTMNIREVKTVFKQRNVWCQDLIIEEEEDAIEETNVESIHN